MLDNQYNSFYVYQTEILEEDRSIPSKVMDLLEYVDRGPLGHYPMTESQALPFLSTYINYMNPENTS